MIRILLETEKTYEGNDYETLVEILSQAGFTEAGMERQAYMREVQKRCGIWGTPIFYHDEESFIKELQRVGVVKKLEIFQ